MPFEIYLLTKFHNARTFLKSVSQFKNMEFKREGILEKSKLLFLIPYMYMSFSSQFSMEYPILF